MKSKFKKIYFYYDLDLFGYYYCISFSQLKNKKYKKIGIYKDSISLLISLDKEILKKEKDYEIIFL